MSGNSKGPVLGKWYLRRIRLNRGGYDSSGSYYGIGAPLYKATCDDDTVVMVRGMTRRMALIELRKQYPKALLHVVVRNRLSQT